MLTSLLLRSSQLVLGGNQTAHRQSTRSTLLQWIRVWGYVRLETVVNPVFLFDGSANKQGARINGGSG